MKTGSGFPSQSNSVRHALVVSRLPHLEQSRGIGLFSSEGGPAVIGVERTAPNRECLLGKARTWFCLACASTWTHYA